MRTLTVPLVLLAGVLLTRPATADTLWTIDPGHSSAAFTVVHLAISRVRGSIPIASGTLETSEAGVPTGAQAVLLPAGLNSENADRDANLKGPQWLDAATFPQITFKSTGVTAAGPAGAYDIAGNLTMHGVTRSVVLHAKLLGKTNDARGRTHVGLSATTTIDRRDYGLNFGARTPGGDLIAGYDVDLDLDIEAVSP